MRHFIFLKSFLTGSRKKTAAALLCLGFVSLTNLVYPWLFKVLIDYLIKGSGNNFPLSLTELTIGLLAVISASAAAGYYSGILMQELGYRLRNEIRKRFFNALLNKPLNFFKKEQVGELTSMAMDDIGKLQGLFSSLAAPAFQNILFIAGCLILMFKLNALAAAFVLTVLILSLPVLRYLSSKVKSYSAESQKEHANANAVMDESFTGIREVKAFTLEKQRLLKYISKNETAYKTEMQSSRYQSKSNQFAFVMVSLLLFLIFYSGVSGFSDWSAGSAAAFYFYAYSLTMSFLTLGRTYSQYNSIAGSTMRIAEIIKNDGPGITLNADLNQQPIKGSVEFKNICFAYDQGSDVLKNISFKADEGEFLLITGPSGSGKSTIINLLMGFYKAQSGEILIDGKNITDIPLYWIRKNIGYVGQEAFLFEGTIRENILLGEEDPGDIELQKILKICSAERFIEELPGKTGAIIAERGVTLSAGQRSRIAIARALVKNPPILILDEANSMLDSSLEKELWIRLLEHRAKRTTIIISHHVDQIEDKCKHYRLN